MEDFVNDFGPFFCVGGFVLLGLSWIALASGFIQLNPRKKQTQKLQYRSYVFGIKSFQSDVQADYTRLYLVERPDAGFNINTRPLRLERATALLDASNRFEEGSGQFQVGQNPGISPIYFDYPAHDRPITKSLMHYFSDWVKNYQRIVDIGGELIPYLVPLIQERKHILHPIAVTLATSIARITKADLNDYELNELTCPNCIARFTKHQVQISALTTETYFGCSQCSQSNHYWPNVCITAYFDTDSRESIIKSQPDDQVQINLIHHKSFLGFHKVHIKKASDEDIERFVVFIGNQASAEQQSLYKTIPVIIAADCKLSTNTYRLLQKYFVLDEK